MVAAGWIPNVVTLKGYEFGIKNNFVPNFYKLFTQLWEYFHMHSTYLVAVNIELAGFFLVFNLNVYLSLKE